MMKVVAVALLGVAAAVPRSALPNLAAHDKVLESEWSEWKSRHGRMYASQAEHDSRRIVFAQNKAVVEQHNAEGHSWQMGLNHYADLTLDEFRSRHGFMGALSTIGTELSTAHARHTINGSAPTSVDWRDHDMVNPVKDQAQCGSCWAFSTVDAYESAVAKKTGTLVSFSEQDLVDCVKNVKLPGSSEECCSGCSGGLMDYGFQYLIDSQSGKDTTEAAYPYTAKDGTCDIAGKSEEGAAAVTSFKDITQGDEDALTDACGTIGVISIAVNAGISGWQLYTGGVFDPTSCNPQELDHGVAVVGYGTDSDSGKDYWIIRNSWGKDWGEDGYMRILKGKNTCGVANSAVYPVV